MAIANWSKVTVRYNFGAIDDQPVTSPPPTFTPEVTGGRLKDAALKEIIYARTVTGTLSNAGTGSVDLYANDDPDIIPTGWTYRVTEPSGYTYSISVPIASVTAGIDLADLAPVDTSGGTGSSGVIGAASESAAGTVQFATAAQVATGTALDRAVSPGRLAAKTWASTSITDFVEATHDTVAGLIVAGTNVTTAYNDASGTLTINATGSGGTTSAATETAAGIVELATAAEVLAATDLTRAVSPGRLAAKTWTASAITDFTEAMQDALATTIVAGTNVTTTYNDTAGTLTINATGSGGTTSAATETAAGIVELASTAEVAAGSDLTRAVSPGRLVEYLAANPPSVGVITLDQLTPGTSVVIDYYKDTYGAAGAWPSAHISSRLDLDYTWRGPLPQPSIMRGGDIFERSDA